MYSSANAHLAEAYERVVVLTPIASGGGPLAAPADRAARLAEGGSRTVVVSPSRAAREAIGPNALDPTVRAGLRPGGP